MLYINKLQVDAAQVGEQDTALKDLANDQFVHDFADLNEARDYVATPKRTDYLGNLREGPKVGVWLRFPKTGFNIVGEEHDFVPLDQTTTSIGATNFIDEQFGTDPLPQNSNFRAAYLAENGALLTKFGVDLAGNLALVGGESLLPKIGYNLALLYYFLSEGAVAQLTSENEQYTGKPLQRYLKIGWGLAKDLVNKQNRTDAENQLVIAVNTYTVLLDTFITTRPVDTFIGDPLVTEQHKGKIPPLMEVCDKFLPVLIERTQTDVKITEQERTQLRMMATGTVEEKYKMFSLWRNLNFASAVKEAAERGVRYSGMGDSHRKWLQKKGRVPNGAHVHVLTKDAFDTTVANMRLS